MTNDMRNNNYFEICSLCDSSSSSSSSREKERERSLKDEISPNFPNFPNHVCCKVEASCMLAALS
jgi:hypothetical protein